MSFSKTEWFPFISSFRLVRRTGLDASAIKIMKKKMEKKRAKDVESQQSTPYGSRTTLDQVRYQEERGGGGGGGAQAQRDREGGGKRGVSEEQRDRQGERQTTDGEREREREREGGGGGSVSVCVYVWLGQRQTESERNRVMVGVGDMPKLKEHGIGRCNWMVNTRDIHWICNPDWRRKIESTSASICVAIFTVSSLIIRYCLVSLYCIPGRYHRKSNLWFK